MVYQQKFVAVIKHDGKILRERDGNCVYLPFQAGYEIFMKNLDSRDVLVDISIDGNNVILSGNNNKSLFIKAKTSVSLEGFINKNNKVVNKFKFLQKKAISKIQKNRQEDQTDDVIIEIKYKFFKQSLITQNHQQQKNQQWYHPYWCNCSICKPKPIIIHTPSVTTVDDSSLERSSSTTQLAGIVKVRSSSLDSFPEIVSIAMKSNCRTITDDASSGEGSKAADTSEFNPFLPCFDEGVSDKDSDTTSILPLEEVFHTIVIRLRGYSGSGPVQKPILVNTKLRCSTCGRKSKSNLKYCPACGSFLI